MRLHVESLILARAAYRSQQQISVISGFIRSLVLNTSTLAPRDGWSGAPQSPLC